MGKYGSFRDKRTRSRHIVRMVTQAVRHAEHETLPDRVRWREVHGLFQGKQNWGDDNYTEEWQSRVFLHEISPMIRDAASTIHQQITEQAEIASLKVASTHNREFAEILESLLLHYIHEIGFGQKLLEFLLSGGIYGVATWKLFVQECVKFKPEVVIEKITKEQEKRRAKLPIENKKPLLFPETQDEMDKQIEDALNAVLGVESKAKYSPPKVKPQKVLELGFELYTVNPFQYYFDPDLADVNAPGWRAERIYKRFHEIQSFFDDGTYDPEFRELMKKTGMGMNNGAGGLTDNYYLQKSRQRDQLVQPTSYFPRMELLEYFGPLLDDHGEIIEENRHFVVGNQKYLLLDTMNPYWDQSPPYFSTIFSRIPDKPIGAGIADNAVEHQKLINQIFSMFIDRLRLDIYAPIAANYDQLMDQSQLDSGLRPGEIIKVFNGSAKDAFSSLPKNTDSSAEMYQALESMRLSGQKGSGVNTMTANPASRARISAAEISSNDSKRQTSVSTLAAEVDKNCIEACFERLKMLVLQFAFSSDNLDYLGAKGVLDESQFELISNMSPVERYKEAIKHYKLEVSGFRAVMDRQAQAARAGEFISQINQMPPEAQEKINWPEVITDLCALYGFKGDRWIRQRDERDDAREENYILEQEKFISVGQNDDDLAHLPIHYELLLKVGPMQPVINHVQMHMQRAQQAKLNIPIPPPEVAEMLGMPAPPTQSERGQKIGLSKLEANEGKKPPLAGLLQ